MKICIHDDNYRLRSFKKKLVLKRWNSATRYVKFSDQRQRFSCLVLPLPHPPIIHEVTSSATQNFKIFQGIMLPDPPRLACPLGHLLSWFIGHLWKRLLRTLIRYRDHTDQETAPWRLHCTVRISFLDRIIIAIEPAKQRCEAGEAAAL